MSIESWKAEFYSEPADEVPELLALAHSLKKWEGLREANLARHDLARCLKDLLGANSRTFTVNGKTCALCHLYMDVCANDDACAECPLRKVRGRPCDLSRRPTESSPYEAYLFSGDPEPMIRLIKRAIKAQGK